MLKAPDLNLTVDIFTYLGVKHYPAGMHRSRYEGSKLRGNNRSNYPLIIHLSSTHPPLNRSWRFYVSSLSWSNAGDAATQLTYVTEARGFTFASWKCREISKICEKNIIDRLFEVMEDMEFPWISFETFWNFAKWSLNSVEVCKAGAGGQQERTRTWQEREAHRAIHDQPVTPSFFPMGWTRRRRRTHGKCCCQMMI